MYTNYKSITRLTLCGLISVMLTGCNPDVLDDLNVSVTSTEQNKTELDTTQDSLRDRDNVQDKTNESENNSSEVEDKTNEESTDPSVEVTQVRLIELNDLHAHLLPHKDIIRENNVTRVEVRGGIAKIATKIKTLRSEKSNSILMNIGDTFHGGAEATFSVGNAIVDAINALNIDVGVVGNWDFAYGPAVTKLRFTDEKPNRFMVSQSIGDTEIKKVNYDVIAANWFKTSLFSADSYMVNPTKIIIKDGIKVGMIGLTSDIVERMHSGFALGMSFTEGKEEYISILNTLSSDLRSQGCHIIVVMSELGIHKDVTLANSVSKGIDIFFSAHTHELTKEAIKSSSGALVVESGNDGYLGVMDVNVSKNNVKTFSWHIETITSDIVDDANVAQIVRRERAPFIAESVNIKNPLKQSSSVLTSSIDEVIAHSELSLNRRGLLENSFNTAFSDLLIEQTQTQLALTPGFRYDAVIDAEADFETKGEIKVSDVYRFFPSSYTLSIAEVEGKHLKEIYEQMLDVVVSKDHFKQNGGWVEKVGGVKVRVNIANEFPNRLLDMNLSSNASPIDDNARYSVAGCNRPGDASDVLCSYPGFLNKSDFINPETSNVYNVSEFFIDALRKDLFHPEHHHDVIDESHINLKEGFIQPLWE